MLKIVKITWGFSNHTHRLLIFDWRHPAEIAQIKRLWVIPYVDKCFQGHHISYHPLARARARIKGDHKYEGVLTLWKQRYATPQCTIGNFPWEK